MPWVPYGPPPNGWPTRNSVVNEKPDMSGPVRTDVAMRTEHAVQDAESAGRDIERISHARLRELVEGDVSDMISHLDDPTLIPADRNRLADTIRNRSNWRAARTWLSLPRLRPSRAWSRNGWLLTCVSLIALALFTTAWLRTPQRLSASVPLTLRFAMPDGTVRTVEVEKGGLLHVRTRGWNYHVVGWIPFQGYATAAID